MKNTRRIISMVLTVIMMLLPLSSLGATEHIDGCTNTDFSTNCCTKTFIIIPKTGYRVLDVIVNGVSKGAITSYTFTNITGPQNLKVITEPIGGSGTGGGTGGDVGGGEEPISGYKVQFNANGGTGSMSSQIFPEGSTQDLKACTYTKQYYHPIGWALSPDGEKVYDEAHVSMSVTEDLILYAIWEPDIYTITYTLNGGSVSGNPTTYTTESATITLKNPTKGDYTFLGWTGSNGETPSTSVTIPIGSGGDRTYTANWELRMENVSIGKYVEYTPTANSASISKSYTGHSADQTLTIDKNANTKMKWKVLRNTSGQLDIISEGSVGDITLNGSTGVKNAVYALNTLCSYYTNDIYASAARSVGSTDSWQSYGTVSNLYTSTYDNMYKHDCDVIQANTSIQNSTKVWLASRSVTDYSSGVGDVYWEVRTLTNGNNSSQRLYDNNYSSTSKALGVRPVVKLLPELKISGGMGTAADPYILALKAYRVTYDANGGTGTMLVQDFDEGEVSALNTNSFTRYGYKFNGWSTTANGSVEYTDGQSISPTTSMTLYAVWELLPTYTVTITGTFKQSYASGPYTTKAIINGTTYQSATTLTLPQGEVCTLNYGYYVDDDFYNKTSYANKAVIKLNGSVIAQGTNARSPKTYSYTITSDCTLKAIYQCDENGDAYYDEITCGWEITTN